MTLVSLEQLEFKLAAAAGDVLAFIRYAIGKALWYKDGPYVWQEIRDPAISATSSTRTSNLPQQRSTFVAYCRWNAGRVETTPLG